MSVKVGVLGCGAIGQRRHIPEAFANSDIELLGVADPLKARVEQVAKKYHTTPYTDWKKLIKAPGVEAIVVGTPNYIHAEQAIAALEAGKHVLVEKPMATSAKDAKAMIAAAKKAKKFLMVGQNQRLMPAHLKAKELLDAGVIGKVLSFRTAFQHAGPEYWSIDGAKSWFFKKDQAVMGVTGDLGVHKIDLMRYLLGQEFVEVGAKLATLNKPIQLDDNAYLTVKTNKGVLGSIIVSWTNYGRGTEENYTHIFGEKGVMALGADPAYGVVVFGSNGEKQKIKVGEMSTNTRQYSSGVIDLFAKCILTNTPPEISGHEGFQALNVILTAMEASKKGKTLKIR